MIPDDHLAVLHLRDRSNARLGQFRVHLEAALALGVIALIASGIARGRSGQGERSGSCDCNSVSRQHRGLHMSFVG